MSEKVCGHGSLKRVCLICELMDELSIERERIERLQQERDAYRKLAAKWAQQAQLNGGKGKDPGYNHCLAVMDDKVKKMIGEK